MIKFGGLRVYLETALDWQAYSLPRDGILILGKDRYPQLVWSVQVQPKVLETDPGPLDARVS
jgi:hypothetical protein